ncbi:S-layer homology domain-containing protein [Oscillibacter valericigenes]|uniref:S-layer homology domain-containing protein n=1 Tax=Oscillibacter valericigenes TaxID=351091 RepID=A0ABS2FUV7_9FIRM|nr:S-layer homology domain-containing protein [Oscillibacter valericigenes]MBM6850848.1 S-layer homology domain-containing protein [Oscillibacter valericigenes]
MKKLLFSLLAAALTAGLLVPSAGAVDTGFSDVPAESALAGEVRKAVDYGLMNGYDNDTFGYGDSMTRAQFTAVLVRMMGWGTVTPQTPSYTDVPASHTWYGVIETAAAHDVADAGGAFRPSDPVTRGEMAELLVRALGLKGAAERLNDTSSTYSRIHSGTPFIDLPEGKAGYIAIAYRIGMTNGTSPTTFSPDNTATRAQAAAMLVRVHEKMHQLPDYVHGFYAISSYSQLHLAEDYTAIGNLADRIILMAYDYDAKDMSDFTKTTYYQTAATVPMDQVYLSLKLLTDRVAPEKVLLGFSARSAAWQIDENGDLLSGTPVYPTAETVAARLAQPDTETGWSDTYQQSYAIYTTEDGGRYFLWYQDDASIQTELRCAKLLGVSGASLWRLGTLPTSADWNWNSLLS